MCQKLVCICSKMKTNDYPGVKMILYKSQTNAIVIKVQNRDSLETRYDLLPVSWTEYRKRYHNRRHWRLGANSKERPGSAARNVKLHVHIDPSFNTTSNSSTYIPFSSDWPVLCEPSNLVTSPDHQRDVKTK